MATPASTEEFLDLVRKSGVTDERRFAEYVTKSRAANSLAADATRMAGVLVRDGILTQFQAEQLLQGKWRRFTIGKYKVLEKIGAGGMGSVYLCEHKLMRRRVAVKVLPTGKAADPSALERFYREARAVAALDHPNIVHAYDIDQDEQLHFLVMEYVDGSNLQDIVKKSGPLDILRACHYIRQSALGLEHAAGAGLVHRDIKPGNILVDRTGTVKILDMGLARFFNDEDDMLTKKFDETVLGTADYLAPEQAIDSHAVDIRADIYSLGATFYFMLSGRAPFGEGTIAQKLLWHQTRQPKPVSDVRKEVPAELVAIINKMMEKDPVNRYQTAGALADDLAPFTTTPIPPPPDSEMPSLSRAANLAAPAEQSSDASIERPEAPKIGGKPPSGGKPNNTAETTALAASNTPVSPSPKGRPAGRQSSVDAPIPTIPDASRQASRAPNLPKPRAKTGAAPTAGAAADVTFEPAVETKPAPKKTSLDRRRKQILFIGAALAAAIVTVAALFVTMKPFSPPPAPPRKALEITSDQMVKTGPFTFRKVFDALQKAKKGDVIQLNDEVHVEQLTFDFDKHKAIPSDITIRPAPGKQVTWTTSNKARADLGVLVLKGAANLKVQGPDLTFDGTLDALDKLKHVVEIRGHAPGLTFENVRIQAFEHSGLRLENAAGEKDRPIRFVGCEFLLAADAKAKAAVIFDANPKDSPPHNDFIEFERTQFVGLKTRFIEAKAGSLGEHNVGIELSKDSK